MPTFRGRDAVLSGTVTRPSSDTLVVTEPRGRALVRLAITLAIVAGFYRVLLGGGEVAAGAHWLLMLVPLFLLPYLLDGVQVLRHGRVFVCDGARRELRVPRRDPIPFAAVHSLEVRAVNGSCEESSVTAHLLDGSRVCVATGTRIAATLALAEELAAILGVDVVRRA